MSEASSSRVKHDALGQRVRDRFNEDPTESEYNKRPGSRHLQLKQRILDNRREQQNDQVSNMSRSHASGFKKNLQGASSRSGKLVTMSEASRMFKRAVDPVVTQTPDQ